MSPLPPVAALALVALLSTSLPTHVATADGVWSNWRGPTANGHAVDQDLPERWTAESVVWKSALPGRGHSSPVVWGDRIFLTAASNEGRERIVIGLSRADGTRLWQQTAWRGEPEPTHNMNGWASATCATDGVHVFAFFGRGGGLHCYTVDGKHVWSRDLGRFESPWGTAASPLLVDDMVIQNCDSDDGAYLIALKNKTGEVVWKTPRPDFRGWSSPILIDDGSRKAIVLNGHTGLTAYDPGTGEELWFCSCERGRGSPTVTPADGRLYVLNGLSGGGLYCVEPGGSGDVTGSHRLWIQRRGGRDLASPIVVNGTVLVMGLRSSILTAYHAGSGKEQWVLRIGGQISASPIAFGGRAYFIDESGKTRVVDPDSEKKLVATNELGNDPEEIFRSALTPDNGQLLIRSDRFLYCVGNVRSQQ